MKLELNDVTHNYQDGSGNCVTPIKNVNLSIAGGETVAILGPSGCGKTTLLFILGCLLKPTKGTVILNGCVTNNLGDSELSRIRGEHIGFLFQLCYLFPSLTVEENILLPAWIQGNGNHKNNKKQLAQELLKQLDLEERMHFLPHQLSGGQRRRVALARSLINNPQIIIADEPTAELEEEKRTVVGGWLMEQAKDQRIVVVATHDVILASQARTIYEIRKGELQKVLN